MPRAKEMLKVYAIGSVGYSLIEIMWRGFTHWTMAIAGGTCFLLIHIYNRRHPDKKLWKKCLMGAAIITGIEFTTGCIVNLIFQLNVWDYSARPLNILGQICPLFSILWFLLCIPVVKLSSYLGRKAEVAKNFSRKLLGKYSGR